MELFTLIARLRGDARIDELAQQLADRSLDGVRARVAPQIAAMGAAEARGYVRARSAAALRPMVDAVLAACDDVKPAWRGRLVEKATEELTRRLLWEELTRRRESASLRRAA